MPGTARFPLDDLLRRHGWQIAQRPNEGEAMWRKGDVLLGQADALERLPWAEVVAARKDDRDDVTEAA